MHAMTSFVEMESRDLRHTRLSCKDHTHITVTPATVSRPLTFCWRIA